jgi:MFS family permease
MLMLVFSNSWMLVILSVMLFGLGHGLLIPSVQNMLLGFTTIKERGAFMSVNSMVLRVGQTLGPLIVGGFYTFGSFPGAFGGGALVALIMFVSVWQMLTVTNPKN